MSNKKTFFVRVDKDGIDTKQSAKEFADFLGEETKPTKRSIKEEPSKVDVAETVFGMFDQLESEIESQKTPYRRGRRETNFIHHARRGGWVQRTIRHPTLR